MEIKQVAIETPMLIVTSEDFGVAYTVFRRLLRVKAFLDTIAEEFIDAK